MSLLRIRATPAGTPQRCEWALLDAGPEPLRGEGPLAQVPRHASRIQLVIPASQVRITRAHLPPAAKRLAGPSLAYAVEDETVGEPESVSVSWLGPATDATGNANVLAVTDKAELARWLDALESSGLGPAEIHCETLLLPWVAGEWSLAWDGREGIVRCGALEGGTTDCGDRLVPPLALRLMLDEACTRGESPGSLAVHVAAGCTPPEPGAWQGELGVPVRLLPPWEWQSAPAGAGVALASPRPRWRIPPGLLSRLRPAAWIAGAALALHGVALAADWTLLAREQAALRSGMAAQFRAAFPDAVAVVDPALQMRRKLAEARHAAGRTDGGDFPPMFAQVAAAANELRVAAPRAASYESGRLSLEYSNADEAGVRRVMARLLESGLGAEVNAPSAPRAAGATIVLTVRAP